MRSRRAHCRHRSASSACGISLSAGIAVRSHSWPGPHCHPKTLRPRRCTGSPVPRGRHGGRGFLLEPPTLAAVVIAVVLLRHTHQSAAPGNRSDCRWIPNLSIAPSNDCGSDEPSSPRRSKRTVPTEAIPGTEISCPNRATNLGSPASQRRHHIGLRRFITASRSRSGSSATTGSHRKGRTERCQPRPRHRWRSLRKLRQVRQPKRRPPIPCVRTTGSKLAPPTDPARLQARSRIAVGQPSDMRRSRWTKPRELHIAKRSPTLAAGSTISSLLPGKYRLEISSPGFVSQAREVDLGTSQLARVDSQLAVGAATETVTVQAGAAMLDTESASVQSTLPDKEPLQTSVTSGTRTLALDNSGQAVPQQKGGQTLEERTRALEEFRGRCYFTHARSDLQGDDCPGLLAQR